QPGGPGRRRGRERAVGTPATGPGHRRRPRPGAAAAGAARPSPPGRPGASPALLHPVGPRGEPPPEDATDRANVISGARYPGRPTAPPRLRRRPPARARADPVQSSLTTHG